MGLQGVELRVFGRVTTSRDSRGRWRPLRGATVSLTALSEIQGMLRRIPTAGGTNPIEVETDADGRFDQRTFWSPAAGNGAPVEPEAFDVDVTDPDGGLVVSAGRVFSNGDAMEIDSGLVPDELPLATVNSARTFDEVPELAAHLAAGLGNADRLGQVSLVRPFFGSRDTRFTSAPEKLFRHFGTLLDRLQAALLNARRHAPGFNPRDYQLLVPTGFKPLEEKVVATIAWYPNLSAAERVRRLVSSYAGNDVTEEVLRRNLPRLTGMLGQILQMPVEYRPGPRLWEDMAVALTLFAGIGLVAQRSHIVWADYIERPTERELILSTA